MDSRSINESLTMPMHSKKKEREKKNTENDSVQQLIRLNLFLSETEIKSFLFDKKKCFFFHSFFGLISNVKWCIEYCCQSINVSMY